MKQKILIAVALFFSMVAIAQPLNTNLIMGTRLPANLAEWASKPQTITMTVFFQGQVSKPVKIRTTIKTASGDEVSTTDMNQAKIYTFRDGNTILTAADIFPIEVQRFTGSFQNSINKTGKLPSDSYTLCVELLLATTYEPQATIKCKLFFVAAAQLPICMMPANNQILDAAVAKTVITFRWTPLVPKPANTVTYRLQVFEVLENQQPVQALRSNQPILNEDIVGITQYIWQTRSITGFDNNGASAEQSKKGYQYYLAQSDTANAKVMSTTGLSDSLTNNDNVVKNSMSESVNGKQFIWSVQALDANGSPIAVDANYEGRSEPVVFSIISKTDRITFPPNHRVAGCVCAGTSWGPIQCRPSAIPTPIAPLSLGWNTLPATCPIALGTYYFHRTTNLEIRSFYNCLSGCQVQLKYELYNSGGTLIKSLAGGNGSKIPFFVPQALGNYYIIIKATCDVGLVCATCVFNFTVVP